MWGKNTCRCIFFQEMKEKRSFWKTSRCSLVLIVLCSILLIIITMFSDIKVIAKNLLMLLFCFLESWVSLSVLIQVSHHDMWTTLQTLQFVSSSPFILSRLMMMRQHKHHSRKTMSPSMTINIKWHVMQYIRKLGYKCTVKNCTRHTRFWVKGCCPSRDHET